MPALDIDIVIETDSASGSEAAVIERAIMAAWSGLADHEAVQQESEVCVVLSDDDAVRKLNADYRAKDKPTNVLSFPQGGEAGDLALPDGMPRPLGDIVIARQTVAREAADQGLAFDNHLAHLAIHGFLHLLGYDHETDAEAEDMEACETRLLASLGIDDPYGSEAA